jgi:hypothetical protein
MGKISGALGAVRSSRGGRAAKNSAGGLDQNRERDGLRFGRN